MNSQKGCIARIWFRVCLFGALSLQILPAQPARFNRYEPAPDEFLSLSNSVIALLTTRDIEKFAAQLTTSAEDWKSIATNVPTGGDDPIPGHLNSSKYERQKVATSAKVLLERADSLHLSFSSGDLPVRLVPQQRFGTTGFPDLQGKGGTLPWTEKVEMIVDPTGGANGSTNGEMKLSVRGLIRFPAGWRSYDGIRWDSFPANLIDEKTKREMIILAKADEFKPLSGNDDPALLKLGATLVRFLREHDVKIYEHDALMTVDLVWNSFQKQGRSGPSREEVEKEIGARVQDELANGRGILRQMDDAGVDLKTAEIAIKEVSLRRIQKTSQTGSLDGMMGTGFQLNLSIKSDSKVKSGASVSGDYVLGIKQLSRFGDEWRAVSEIRWQELPAGVVDEKAVAAMKFDNYVAEYGTLPPNSAAPEIEFTTLAGEKKMKLSELRGKVVVLDFWATWCGPCQQPMADLQKIQRDHAEWTDKVAIVPLSIDDEIATVRQHVNKRGWTNTFNVWAGEGGWRAAPAKTFHVTGVPTTYILDQNGKVVVAGHPAGLPIEQQVERLLAHKRD